MRTSRSRSPIVATFSPPAGSCSRGRPPTCVTTKTCERRTLAVSTDTLPARCRHRFPIFERLTYINSCSQGALSDSVRASYDDYLTGWDERGAPWDYWVERSEAARAVFARLVEGEPDDVAVTTSLSAGVR